MRSVLGPALTGTFMFQPVTEFQVTRYATPLARMVFTSTGASPTSVTRLFGEVSGPLAVKLGVSLAASCDNMLVRALAIQLFREAGETTLMPLVWNAAYLASMIGLTLVASIGPL